MGPDPKAGRLGRVDHGGRQEFPSKANAIGRVINLAIDGQMSEKPILETLKRKLSDVTLLGRAGRAPSFVA